MGKQGHEMNDVYAWIAGNTAAVLAFGTWLLRLQKQTNDAERDAKTAREDAMAVRQALAELHNTITALTASFSLFKERAAAELVSQTSIRDLETRLVRQNDDLRSTVQELNKRFDTFLALMLSERQEAPAPRRRAAK